MLYEEREKAGRETKGGVAGTYITIRPVTRYTDQRPLSPAIYTLSVTKHYRTDRLLPELCATLLGAFFANLNDPESPNPNPRRPRKNKKEKIQTTMKPTTRHPSLPFRPSPSSPSSPSSFSSPSPSSPSLPKSSPPDFHLRTMPHSLHCRRAFASDHFASS